MPNRPPSVSPLAFPLRRMQAAGVVGRINPYCSCRANFRSVKEVKACLPATSDSSIISKESKSPSSIFSIRTPPSKRSTHNVITPEARSMMKDAIAEFSSPLTAGVVGRINPYCSCPANFRSVKEVKACLSATSDSSIISKESKSPSSIFSIRTPPSKRSTHNVITPEVRSMMKDAIAEFSSPLTDIKKIPIRESPLFSIPPSKRRKLFDMRDSILKEVEMRKMKQKSEKDNIIERQNSIDIAVKKHYDRINAEQELRNIQELYPEFSFSNPISLKNKSITKQSFDGQFIFSNTVSANLTNTGQEIVESKDDNVTPTNST